MLLTAGRYIVAILLFVFIVEPSIEPLVPRGIGFSSSQGQRGDGKTTNQSMRLNESEIGLHDAMILVRRAQTADLPTSPADGWYEVPGVLLYPSPEGSEEWLIIQSIGPDCTLSDSYLAYRWEASMGPLPTSLFLLEFSLGNPRIEIIQSGEDPAQVVGCSP
jgi:hypothetical protein